MDFVSTNPDKDALLSLIDKGLVKIFYKNGIQYVEAVPPAEIFKNQLNK